VGRFDYNGSARYRIVFRDISDPANPTYLPVP